MMSSHAKDLTPTAKNIGLHVDPDHNIYVAEASPSLEEVKDGCSLQPSEVTVAIKSTGICG